jgi:hypothetical protein
VLGPAGDYLIGVRHFAAALLVTGFLIAKSSAVAGGSLVKVLPEYLDLKGRNSLSPSLYERDVYQVSLREHPEKRSGLRFYIQWRSKNPVWESLLARVELRGISEGKVPRRFVLERTVPNPGGASSHWTDLIFSGDAYQKFGAVTAWRVTIWEGQTLIGREQSFLW